MPAPPRRPAFDRGRWEQAVLDSHLPANARLVALALPHCAPTTGQLPPDGPQRPQRLAERTRLKTRHIRISLTQLEFDGFISRPALDEWSDRRMVRPLRLTMPHPSPVSPEPIPEKAGG